MNWVYFGNSPLIRVGNPPEAKFFFIWRHQTFPRCLYTSKLPDFTANYRKCWKLKLEKPRSGKMVSILNRK